MNKYPDYYKRETVFVTNFLKKNEYTAVKSGENFYRLNFEIFNKNEDGNIKRLTSTPDRTAI